ncbi:MAG: ribbon-helix-helix protein, CopG family [Azospirillaceae bacterium]
MATHKVTVRLNQQQLELIERTVEKGEAPDPEALIRRALREYVEAHPPAAGR